MRRVRVGVYGASGYTGAELLRYLDRHPVLDVVWATAGSNAGRRVIDVSPHLVRLADLELQPMDAPPPELDLAFLALPHGAAAVRGRDLLAAGVRVVDLSADWRLSDPTLYGSWYGWSHPAPDELSEWVYGLPELHRDRIAGARGIANPGCYPTAAVLALQPLVSAGLAVPPVVVDAASGISGAGRKVDADYLFTELDASYSAYGVGRHRHTPEIEQELGVPVTFTPHLAPMSRGLLATCYAHAPGADEGRLRETLERAYGGSPFVRVVSGQPSTKQVWGTNLALIGVGHDARTSTAVVTCAIDNLGKGAAGQAVQNANLMLGLAETCGLEAMAVHP
ncbi:MAG TPA: N-acetyl-gamma-glutamyl-phosphate reductase [Actinomycetota bacterium]|nr:N-acetyl-gamma-glutamyl-phosphate reductase [Actinomycetota bacterium]